MHHLIKDNLKKYRTAIFVITSLAFGIAIGLNIHSHFQELDGKERHESGYSFISPLIECFSDKSDSPENNKLEEIIERKIEELTEQKKMSGASVYFRDLANGPWIGINEEKQFTPASLLKVPIMITYFKMAETNPDILKQEIEAKNADQGTTIPNIIPAEKITIGKKYTINELINHMIIYSDNQAANILLSNMPKEVFMETYDNLGLTFPTIEKPENYMSVKDYASFFRILYNASYLNKYYSEQALYLLSQSKYQNGLVAGIPSGVVVSHKFGERKTGDVEQLHDCGIVYKQNKDYLLCIMTRGENFNDLSEAIKDISKVVYDNVN